jgi:hypothetical protein
MIRYQPRIAFLASLFGVVVALSAIAIVRDLLRSMVPKDSVILGYVITPLDNGSYDLAARTDSPESPYCLRERQDLLMGSIDGERHFIPLGSGRNGLGIGRAGVFVQHFPVPSWVRGHWEHISRLTYTCPIFPIGSVVYNVQGGSAPGISRILTFPP